MTETEIKIAIAEARGWTSRDGFMDYDGEKLPFTIWIKDGKEHNSKDLPDYPNDLNAMAEAEAMLNRETGHLSVNCLIRNYWLKLMEIMNPGVKLWDKGTFIGNWSHAIKVGSATARQRAEAFLRTLNLWREEK